MSSALGDYERIDTLARRFFAAGELPLQLVYEYAALLLRLERAVEALALLEAEMERVHRAGDPTMLLQMLQSAASAHLRQWDDAENMLREAQPLVEQGAATVSVSIQIAMRHAELAQARNDAGSARRHIEAALALAGYGTPEPQPELARALMSATNIALTGGRLVEARQYASDALRISESVSRYKDSSADVGEALLLLAKARAGSAARAEQRAWLERAVSCLKSGLRFDHPLTHEASVLLAKVS